MLLILATPTMMASAYIHTNSAASQPLVINQALIQAVSNGHRNNGTHSAGPPPPGGTCTGTYCVDLQLADSNDGYQRDWAIFYGSPGAYVSNGAWTNMGSNVACEWTYVSSGTLEPCDSMSTSTYLYYCVSVPDTGFSPGYSGSADLWHSVALIAAYFPSGITENYCYQGTGL